MADRSLTAKMEELAEMLADQALSKRAPEKELIDAFKSLTGYYLGTEKLMPEDDKPEPTKGTGFGAIKARIEDASKEKSH